MDNCFFQSLGLVIRYLKCLAFYTAAVSAQHIYVNAFIVQFASVHVCDEIYSLSLLNSDSLNTSTEVCWTKNCILSLN